MAWIANPNATCQKEARRADTADPWPALQSSGRPPQAPANPTGLQASAHAHSDTTAARRSRGHPRGGPTSRRDHPKKFSISFARSLDSIAAACNEEEKPVAQEITSLFTTFLSTNLLSGKTGADPTPGNDTNGWATGPRAGAGKAPARAHTATQKNTNRTTEAEDIRILARLPQEQLEWAKTVRSFALRTALCDQIGLSLVDVPNIFHTATGFAIHPRNKEIRQKILAKDREAGQSLRATKLELPTKWYNYVVPNCPTKLPNLLGEMLDVSTVIEDEVIAQTRHRPIRIRPSRHGPDVESERGSWIISFLEEVPAFRLFDSSARARLIQKKPAITRHDPGCQGYHPDRFCTRNARCGNCGAPATPEHPQPCENPAKCANCYGPAQAGHDNCPAKPTRKNGKLKLLTKKELTAIRKAGQKLYNARHNNTGNPRTGPTTVAG